MSNNHSPAMNKCQIMLLQEMLIIINFSATDFHFALSCHIKVLYCTNHLDLEVNSLSSPFTNTFAGQENHGAKKRNNK